MTFFTIQEFKTKYNIDVENYQIEMASEMIYSQVGLRYRDPNWNSDTCPTAIKNASMEQLRFMLEYDIPLIDYKDKVKAGEMETTLSGGRAMHHRAPAQPRPGRRPSPRGPLWKAVGPGRLIP